MWAERSELREVGGVTLFVDVTAPAPRLVIFGAVDYAAALCTLARAAGWRAFVCDPRSQFATRRALPRCRGGDRRLARGGVRAPRRDRPRHLHRRADPRPEARRRRARVGAALRGALRRRDGQPARAGAAPRAAARGRDGGGAAGARGRADRPRPGRAHAGGDGALDHGRGGAVRHGREGGRLSSRGAGASTRWARDRRPRAGGGRRHALRRAPSSSPSSTAARCSSTRSGR